MGLLFILLFVYQIKHFLCDYTLQGRYMLGKFKNFPDYILPLLAHVSVHGFATFLIASACHTTASPLALALFDMVAHFIMDRIKASPKLLGRFKPLSAKEMGNILSYLPTLGKNGVTEKFGKELRGNTFFWWSLGLDQMVHHLTHYIIIYWLMS